MKSTCTLTVPASSTTLCSALANCTSGPDTVNSGETAKKWCWLSFAAVAWRNVAVLPTLV